jgi:hypothetical protein
MMQSELARQIGELVEAGAAPVSSGEARARAATASAAGPAARPRAGRRRMAIGGVAAGIAAAGCAAGLLIATVHPGSVAARPGAAAAHPGASAARPGTASSGSPGILTTAMVQRVAAASQAALASSGREEIIYQNRKNGAVDGHGDDVITFSGGNYNWVMNDLDPPVPSLHIAAMDTSGITTFVNGVAYIQPEANNPKSPWLRASSWRLTPSFPQPKTALQLLSPQAKFVRVGWQVIGGVRLEHLRATVVTGLPGGLTFAGYRQPGEKLSALDLWVDASGVLHQMKLELASSDSSTTMTVTLGQFGQPETITAPAHWLKSSI